MLRNAEEWDALKEKYAGVGIELEVRRGGRTAILRKGLIEIRRNVRLGRIK